MKSFKGLGLAGQTWHHLVEGGQANSTSLPPNPKVNKAEKETYLSKHCAYNFA